MLVQRALNVMYYSTQPFILLGWKNRVSACLAGGEAGHVHLCQVVTLMIAYGRWHSITLTWVSCKQPLTLLMCYSYALQHVYGTGCCVSVRLYAHVMDVL